MGPPGRSVALCGAPRALRLAGASGVATPSSRPRLSGALSRVESCAGTVSGVGSCPHHYIDVCVHFRRVWSDLNDVDTFGPALSAACLFSPLSARAAGGRRPPARGPARPLSRRLRLSEIWGSLRHGLSCKKRLESPSWPKPGTAMFSTSGIETPRARAIIAFVRESRACGATLGANLTVGPVCSGVRRI